MKARNRIEVFIGFLGHGISIGLTVFAESGKFWDLNLHISLL